MTILKNKDGLPEEEVMKLKKACAKCNQYQTELVQVRDLEMLPDGAQLTKKGLEDMFMVVATHTSESNTLIETVKGRCRAKRN